MEQRGEREVNVQSRIGTSTLLRCDVLAEIRDEIPESGDPNAV
jgi:hypothetical protein